MPNWCSNYVEMHNEDKSKVDELQAVLERDSQEEEEGILMHLLPRPSEENENWYSWNVENWGTKWDVRAHDWNRIDDNTIDISFDSAWGPPTVAYENLEEDQGWTINAKYEEPGMAFVGEWVEGFEETYEYDFEDEDWRDTIPDHLIEYAGLDEEYESWKEWQEDEDETEVD